MIPPMTKEIQVEEKELEGGENNDEEERKGNDSKNNDSTLKNDEERERVLTPGDEVNKKSTVQLNKSPSKVETE